MTRGKKKCEILKTVRCQVAKKNGIPYTYTECTYQGECRGTCPKCEEELRYLTRELEKLKKSGKQVAVAGVAAAVIATTAAGCSSDFLEDLGFEKQSQIAGAMPAPTPTEQYVTMGVPAPQLPEIVSAVNTFRRGEQVYVSSFDREELQTKWGDWLTESGENYDVFLYNGVRIRIGYNDMDYVETAEFSEEEEMEIEGMMLPPEDEFVTAGEPMPGVPFISDVIADLQQGNEVYMDYFERTAIQVEWEAYLTESGEDYDIFTVDGEQIIVTYRQDGWGDSVTLYAGITTEDAQ